VVYLLDTNTLGDYWRYGETRIVGQRVAAIPDPETNRRISVITFEEMIGGRALDLRRNPYDYPHLQPLPVRYRWFMETYVKLNEYYPPLPFDEEAQTIFQSIPKALRNNARVNDCKIAAIAVRNKCTVVSANQADFDRIKTAIPVQQVDWTIAPLI
jgi:predicted nucleic acid-binding protein